MAGAATIVFENSTATGNTTGMPHTLTFVTSDPEFNNDVQLNILANPNDDQGGRHTAEVTLTPGRYFYHCTIPGHGQMQGILVVTEGTGEDTTAPATAAQVTGTQNAQGEYVGSASVALTATDDAGLRRRRDRVRGRRRGRLAAVHHPGRRRPGRRPQDPLPGPRQGGQRVGGEERRVHGRRPALGRHDPAGHLGDGERRAERRRATYLDMATVTVSASDTGSGVNTIEYAVNDGAWQPYTAPVMVHQVGTHTVRYRATDKAGNAAAEKSVRVHGGREPPPRTPRRR